MRRPISFLFVLLFLSRCEKIVDLDYKSNRSRITIEGNITNAAGPYLVKITKSVSLSETSAYPTIDNAMVSISDDAGNSEILLPQGNGTFSTTVLEGVEGRSYTLTVESEGQVYTAQSTMPEYVPFDSIKVSEVKIGSEIERDLIPVYQDPISMGNNYRFVLSLNDKLIKQHLIQNDLIRNGLVNTINLEINDDDLVINAGDLVCIEMQCIDTNMAAYYTALALMGDSGPGGGTTPNNPPNNISNGALGTFSAHTAERRTVTIR